MVRGLKRGCSQGVVSWILGQVQNQIGLKSNKKFFSSLEKRVGRESTFYYPGDVVQVFLQNKQPSVSQPVALFVLAAITTRQTTEIECRGYWLFRREDLKINVQDEIRSLGGGEMLPNELFMAHHSVLETVPKEWFRDHVTLVSPPSKAVQPQDEYIVRYSLRIDKNGRVIGLRDGTWPCGGGSPIHILDHQPYKMEVAALRVSTAALQEQRNNAKASNRLHLDCFVDSLPEPVPYELLAGKDTSNSNAMYSPVRTPKLKRKRPLELHNNNYGEQTDAQYPFSPLLLWGGRGVNACGEPGSSSAGSNMQMKGSPRMIGNGSVCASALFPMIHSTTLPVGTILVPSKPGEDWMLARISTDRVDTHTTALKYLVDFYGAADFHLIKQEELCTSTDIYIDVDNQSTTRLTSNAGITYELCVRTDLQCWTDDQFTAVLCIMEKCKHDLTEALPTLESQVKMPNFIETLSEDIKSAQEKYEKEYRLHAEACEWLLSYVGDIVSGANTVCVPEKTPKEIAEFILLFGAWLLPVPSKRLRWEAMEDLT